jgi:HNH endonuclease
MLYEDRAAFWEQGLGKLIARERRKRTHEANHRLKSGAVVGAWRTPDEMKRMFVAAEVRPVPVMRHNGKTWWQYRDKTYWESDGLAADDVAALADQRTRRKTRALDHARALADAAASGELRRPPIPKDVKLAVWSRDTGRCVECGAADDLQFDHIIPFSMGGSSTVNNLQLLCARCNLAKGGHR